MLLQVIADVVLGMAMGLMGGLFGIGGGLIAIPVLGLFFGMDQQVAQGTALVMVVPNVLLAIWRYNQRNRINWHYALALAVPSFFCAYGGANLAIHLDEQLMRWVFAGFLVALSLYILLRTLLSSPGKAGDQARHSWRWMVPLGAVSGFVGGLFAVGGAVVATPVLTGVFGLGQVVAHGLSLSLAVPSTTVALFTYAVHGHVDWFTAIPLALGGMTTVGLGVRIAYVLPDRLLRALFSLFLMISAVLLAIR